MGHLASDTVDTKVSGLAGRGTRRRQMRAEDDDRGTVGAIVERAADLKQRTESGHNRDANEHGRLTAGRAALMEAICAGLRKPPTLPV